MAGLKYRIELGRHGKDTRVYVDDEEITTKIDLIELRVPCDDRPTLSIRSPFDDFDNRVLDVEHGTVEIMSIVPGEVIDG